jgi:hypothetical protein
VLLGGCIVASNHALGVARWLNTDFVTYIYGDQGDLGRDRSYVAFEIVGFVSVTAPPLEDPSWMGSTILVRAAEGWLPTI